VRWFANLLVLAFPLATSAQVGQGDVESQVRLELSRRWDRPVAGLVLEWSDSLPAGATFRRLSGAGRDGHFVLLYSSVDGLAHGVRLRAGVRDSVPVAVRDLPSEHELTPADWGWDEAVQWGGPTSMPVIPNGFIVRRPTKEGEELRVPRITPPVVSRAGERVVLVLSRDWGNLTFPGTLLQDAVLGNEVAVRLDHGDRRVRARVMEDGTFTWIGS
jgi:hypothetical protein